MYLKVQSEELTLCFIVILQLFSLKFVHCSYIARTYLVYPWIYKIIMNAVCAM